MKKPIIIFSVVLATIVNFQSVHAQGTYLGAGGGYGTGLASQTMTFNETGFLNTDHFYETVKGTYGKGINFGIYAGHAFNPNWSAELGIYYLAGGKTKRHYLKESSATEDLVLSAKMIRIIPSIRMTAGDGKIKPYMKIGMVIGAGGKITINDTWTDIGCNCGNTETTWEYSKGISLGATGSLGANYTINEKISLFGEMNFIAQSWAPKKGILKIATRDGVDQLPGKDTNQKEIDFLKSYTLSGTPDVSEPAKQIKNYSSFSSIGINIGINYSFGGGK